MLMYGCEARTFRQKEKKKINATEMGCWRKLLNIPWTAHRTNESILKELKIKRRLSDEIQLRIIRHSGGIMRRELNNMGSLIIQGKVEGTGLRGRSEMRWIDQITKSTGKRMHALTTETLDRDHWKEMVNEFAVVTTVTQETTD
jgi:hypothetical protein